MIHERRQAHGEHLGRTRAAAGIHVSLETAEGHGCGQEGYDGEEHFQEHGAAAHVQGIGLFFE
ncbi:MAG: hypothetical protein WC832_10320, partial [Anaerolineales bacterium]